MKVVYLNDSNLNWNEAIEYFDRAADWAKEQCPSFLSHYIQDVTDVSYIYDQVAEYKFNDPKDAMWFELKWRR